MSNRRRPPGTRQGPQCAACGHRIAAGAERVPLPRGQVACGRCRDRGVLTKRMPCGHLATWGSLLVYDSADQGNLQCLICTPYQVSYILGVRQISLAVTAQPEAVRSREPN